MWWYSNSTLLSCSYALCIFVLIVLKTLFYKLRLDGVRIQAIKVNSETIDNLLFEFVEVTENEEKQLKVIPQTKFGEIEVVVKPTENLEIVIKRFEEVEELPKEEEVPGVAKVPEKVTLEIVPKEMPTPAAAAPEFDVTPQIPVTDKTKVEELPEVVTTYNCT